MALLGIPPEKKIARVRKLTPASLAWSWPWRLLGKILQFAELIGLVGLWEQAMDWFTPSRSLTRQEYQLAVSVFGKKKWLEKVRICPRERWIGKRKGYWFVLGHTIHGWGALSEPLLLHELTHVWQMQRYGASYMARALAAQHHHMGYNYGGGQALRRAREAGWTLFDFNLEQQADIVADYYRLRSGKDGEWQPFSREYEADYLYFIDQVK